MQTIWQKLPKNFMVLAPMEDVTDTVFRRIVLSCGKPDLFFTEFASVDGLFSEGFEHVSKRFTYTESERPLIAQIWGMKPENYFKAGKLLKELGFDGIDINMGCPVRAVVKQGACSALIKNQSLAKELIQATTEGAGGLPVSVKTRLGFASIQTEEWIGFLLELKLAALTIHARTVKEMSDVPAHWEEVSKAVQLKNKHSPETKIIGNGDIHSLKAADERILQTKADGMMIGRGIFHDPWLFNRDHFGEAVSFEEKIAKLIEHITLFTTEWQERRPFMVMKKFFKCYISGFPGASELRLELMECQTFHDAIGKLNALKKINFI